MSTYAIGDVQGCYSELNTLLDLIDFSPGEDRLLFTGDLVNRGPDSLEVLRLVKDMGEAAVVVLGNHDLHLLAVAHGVERLKRRDTLDAVLNAGDGPELLEWLRFCPLAYTNIEPRCLIVHAGIVPQWSTATVMDLAREVEAELRGESFTEFFASMYGDHPQQWHDELRGPARLRVIINCLTRMRYCDEFGRMSLADKGPPGTQTDGYLPWYEVPGRRTRSERIAFGHWSTLVLDEDETEAYQVYPLDRGCVWGGELLALRLEDMSYIGVPAARAYA